MAAGDRWNRIEEREVVGATEIERDEASGSIHIAYDEGGDGWWPAECLAAIPPSE